MLFAAQELLYWFRVFHFHITMQTSQSNCNSIILLRSDIASIFYLNKTFQATCVWEWRRYSIQYNTIYNTAILIDNALHRRSCAAVCQHRFYKTLTTLKVYVRLTKHLSLLYDWHLLNVRQAKYLFSAMFVGRNSNCDVINALCSKAMITWKYFLMCFHNQINTTIYSKYSQTSFVRTPINQNPCISSL